MSAISALDQITLRDGNAPGKWEELLDIISNSRNDLSQFLQYYSNKLQNSGDSTILLLLDVLEYLIDYGNFMVREQVSSKQFISSLINVLKSKKVIEIQTKILCLFKKWGEKFKNERDKYPNFTELYENLLSNKVVFPNSYVSEYPKFLQPKNNNSNGYSSSYQNDFNQGASYAPAEQNNLDDEFDYVASIKMSLNPSQYEKKYHKLIDFLVNTIETISLANEIIDNSQVGRTDDSGMQVMETLRTGNNRLIETVTSDRLKDEKLMEIALGVTDDINRTTNRWDILRQGTKPDPFLSSFVEKSAMNDVQIPMKKKKKPQPAPSQYSQPQPRSQLPQNPEVNPRVKDANDLFDIFSNPSNPVQQNPSLQKEVHPMDLFDMNSGQSYQSPLNFGGNPNSPVPGMGGPSFQEPPKSNADLLQQQLKMAYNNNGMGNQQPMNQGYPSMSSVSMQQPGMNNMNMGAPQSNMDMRNMNNMDMQQPMQMGMDMQMSQMRNQMPQMGNQMPQMGSQMQPQINSQQQMNFPGFPSNPNEPQIPVNQSGINTPSINNPNTQFQNPQLGMGQSMQQMPPQNPSGNLMYPNVTSQVQNNQQMQGYPNFSQHQEQQNVDAEKLKAIDNLF